MSDDRVREIRARLELYLTAENRYAKDSARLQLYASAASDIEALLADLDRAERLIEIARLTTDGSMLADLACAVREYDAARSPELSGGTTVADSGEPT